MISFIGLTAIRAENMCMEDKRACLRSPPKDRWGGYVGRLRQARNRFGLQVLSHPSNHAAAASPAPVERMPTFRRVYTVEELYHNHTCYRMSLCAPPRAHCTLLNRRRRGHNDKPLDRRDLALRIIPNRKAKERPQLPSHREMNIDNVRTWRTSERRHP
jgi:hypothetical protein